MRRISSKFSSLSMAMALAVTGVAGLSLVLPSQAAIAKEKKEKKKKKGKEKEPQLELSKEFRAQFTEVKKLTDAKDYAGAKPGAEALLASSKTPDEKYVAGQVLLNISVAAKDSAGQYTSLKAILTSGKAPPEDIGKFNFYAGNFAYEQNDFALARQYYKTSIDSGYKENGVDVRYSEAFIADNMLSEGLVALEQAINNSKAAGTLPPEQWYRRGASIALKLSQPDLINHWTGLMVDAYPSSENWRTALVLFRDFAKYDKQENLDLMRLMRATDSLESEADYNEYVDNAGPRLLPGEVVDVIEEGRAKGKLKGTSQYFSDLLNEAKTAISGDKAGLPGAERDAVKSPNGKTAIFTADAFLAYKDYDKALSLYKMAMDKGGIDNNTALTRIGIIQYYQGDLDAAKATFASVTGPRKPLAEYWIMWIDQKLAPAASAAAQPAEAEAAPDSNGAGEEQ